MTIMMPIASIAPNSYRSAHIGRDTVSPRIIVLSVAPIISCGYFSPIGVARGFASPSAVIPIITVLPSTGYNASAL